jgi:signal transduction histidine kinase/ligand-binding sensor domain-containing protein
MHFARIIGFRTGGVKGHEDAPASWLGPARLPLNSPEASVAMRGVIRRLRCSILAGLFLGMLAWPGCVRAQDATNAASAPFFIRSWQHEQWQNEQGLPNNTVNAVTQTHDGYLWLGTDEGLARFDGVRCRVFGSQDGLKNLQISALMEDSRGVLWVGTAGGGVGRMIAERITTYTVADGLAGDSISSLIEDNHGNVWVATHTGLSRWHAGKFQTMAKELGPILTFDLAKDQQGDIWVATLHNGLLRFHGDQFSVADGEKGYITNNPRCVMVDSQNRVWAGLRERTMLCFDHGTWTRYGTNEGFPDVFTYCMAETPDGTIWAGSWNEGIYYFRDGRFHALRKADGLSDEAILSLYAGREKFLWAGTQSGGLNRIGPRKLQVYHVMEGSSEGQLRSLAQTTDGQLWAGTYGQGIYRWAGDQFTSVQDSRVRGHLLVETMLGARDGSLWWGAGPALYRWKNDKLLEYYGDLPWLASDRVWSLCEDRGGGLWVGTYNGKVGLLKQGKFAQQKGFSGKPVTSMAQAPDGTLWVGSLGGGLARLQNGKLTVLTTRDGLPSDLIRCLFIDAEGTLWLGTDGGGLNRLRDGKIDSFSTRQGLLDNTILQILEDDSGSLWLGCNRGICRVSKRVLNDVAAGKAASVHALDFRISDGMASEECVGYGGAALKTRSGQLCFATAKGIVVIDPREQAHDNILPEALMEDVLVDNERLAAAPAREPAADGRAGGIQIPAGKHTFEFNYTGINFDAPEKIQFRYRLDGLDADWTEAGNVRVARYSYIPPGAYRFRVQACSASRQWNEPGTGLSFVVLPHFWQTWWFAVLLAGAAVGALGLGIRLVERRRYRARLQRLEREQAMERERMRIAQDLHDELGSSLTYISMSITDLGQSPERDAERLKSRVSKISRFAVRTARALDEIVWAVNPRNDSLRSLVEYLTELARELFENTEARCRFQIAAKLPDVPLPPAVRHNIFLTVREALNNALKHARATEIVFSAKTTGSQIEIALQDDGVGFDPAAVPAHGGQDGLQNMRARVEAIGGRFQLETAPGHGTTIRLVLKSPASAAGAPAGRG